MFLTILNLAQNDENTHGQVQFERQQQTRAITTLNGFNSRRKFYFWQDKNKDKDDDNDDGDGDDNKLNSA